MKINLNPCFFSIDLPWKTILDQEGLNYNIIKTPSNHCACIIITDETNISFKDIEKFVLSGGTILVSSNKWKTLSKTKNYYKFSSLLIPKENSYFSSLEYIEMNDII